MKIGYGRVSTTGQRLDPQSEALTNFGCEKIFLEKRSGKSSKDRPELQNLLDQVSPGDVVVVTKNSLSSFLSCTPPKSQPSQKFCTPQGVQFEVLPFVSYGLFLTGIVFQAFNIQ